MDIVGDAGKLYQVTVALILAISFFLLAYVASPRKTVPWLVCMSPIPLIDSPYTTSSVLITYVVAIVYVMRGRLKFVPMLGFFLIIFGIYVAGTGFAHRSTHGQHVIYLFNFFSAVLMFYIVYNFVRETRDIGLAIRILIITNLLVLAYSIVQINVGPRFALFGIQELAIKGARGGDDPRLAGPFGVGITAEHFVISILMLAFLSIHAKTILKRTLIYLLMAVNLGCLVATANRGGFLALVGGAGLFILVFRSELGVKRTLTLSAAGVFLLGMMSIVIVNYTDYGQMYERLEATELEGGMPDSRARTWTTIAPEIAKKPILGYGPRFRLLNDHIRPYPDRVYLHYPHNLYLFLLYTVGVVGLIVYLWFFAWLFMRFRAGLQSGTEDPFARGFVKLGMLIVVVFLVDQIKVEFLRFGYIGYWHYIFGFFAVMLGFADLLRRGEVTCQMEEAKPSDQSAAALGRPITGVSVS